MIKGSCLCRSTRWQVDGEMSNMSHCHCSMCRKAHGAPFATYVNARAKDFTWTAGGDDVKHYESSPDFGRAFCGTCGSVVPLVFGEGDEARLSIPAGCLDDDPGVRAHEHIFASSAPAWSHVSDDLPHHDAYADPNDGPNIAQDPKGEPAPGILRGSCLCNSVAYEISTPIKAVHNCHCTRCRKARAAAHTTNGFTAMSGVRFVRGEELLTSFKLPDAKSFTVTFCSKCGSGMPRLDASRDIAVIPYGSLDDEPEMKPMDHIFQNSKAPWYEPSDGLPLFDEYPG